MVKRALCCFALITASIFQGLVAQTGVTGQLKSFHLRFDKYTQSSSDGSYTFHFEFSDVAPPHIKWPGGTEPKSEFKIGDVIGQYRIAQFTPKIEVPGPGSNIDSMKRDVSALTLENIAKPGKIVSVRFREQYNLPNAGTPLSGIAGVLSKYNAGDDEAPLLKELNLDKQPSFFYPNLPVGEERVDYFLPEGNVIVSTKLSETGASVFSSAPFFVDDRTPIADRLKKYNAAMDEYAKKHGAK